MFGESSPVLADERSCLDHPTLRYGPTKRVPAHVGRAPNHPSPCGHVRLYEHPACQAPRRAPLSSFLSFLPRATPFSSSTAPQAFPRPDRRMLPPARAGCVKAGRFSAATVRLGLYTTEHDSRLDGFGRLLLSCYLSVSVSARVIPITNVLSAGLATKSMARAMFASTYIRQLRSGLPRCCLHGRSCRRDGAHLSDGRLANADLRCGHTATHPTRPTHPTGVSELSALSTLSREGRSLRNQTLLEIAPEGNGELARHCNDHDALNAPVLPFGPLHKPLRNRALGLMLDPQPG